LSAPNTIGPGSTINGPSGGGGPPGPPGPPGTSAAFIWRPGGVASASVLVTWAQVEVVIAANSGAVVILVDTSIAPAIVPAIADTECFGRVEFGTYTYTVTAFAEITVADGGRLKNPHRFVSCTIRGAPTVRPFIELTLPGMGLFFERGPGLILDLGATQAAVHVAVGAAFAIISNFEGAIMQSATGIAPAIVDIDPLTVVLFAVIAAAGVNTGYAYPANTFSGAAAGSVTFLTDASAPFNPQTLLIGGQNYQPFDKAAGVIYDDALVLPPLGAVDVQAAIDALKTSNPSGVYTPALTPISNVAIAPVAHPSQWQQNGKIVTVFGTLDFRASVALIAPSVIEISLPVPTVFTGGLYELNGSGIVGGTLGGAVDDGTIARVQAQTFAPFNKARLQVDQPTTLSTTQIYYQFSYQVSP